MTTEQAQKPKMTQELIQAIQILQFNNQELAEYIENELLENPILEKDKTSEETVDIDELREKLLEANAYDNQSSSYTESWDTDREEFSFERYVAFKHSLIEHLLSQLQFAGFSEDEFSIGRYIIQCIDDNGYLTSSIDEISEALGVDSNSVESVLATIQAFDPIGVGARSLEECLSLQLKQSGEADKSVFAIVNNRLEDLAKNRFAQIAKDMSITTAEVQHIADRIKKLDPKPGRLFDSDATIKYVIPDVFVDNDGENFLVRNNDYGTPQLVISPIYNELKEKSDESEELRRYLTEKFNAAMWLIKSIEQRRSTITKVATAILEFQEGFFRSGTKYLKPLTLRQVGDAVGIHESTVSRSINGKYLQCGKGVFELKYFFSGGLKTDDGDDFSSNSVKEIIKEIIDAEDSKHPLSDSKIVEMLLKEGIDISRRTVAKYREAMGIQSSSGRKRY